MANMFDTASRHMEYTDIHGRTKTVTVKEKKAKPEKRRVTRSNKKPSKAFKKDIRVAKRIGRKIVRRLI